MEGAANQRPALRASRYVRVKICGVTRVADAVAAQQAGADAVGFVFAPGSKRRVSTEQAAQIASELGPFVALVGVFVDAPLQVVESAVERVGLTAVQLHGNENAAYAARLTPTVKVIRALAFDPAVTPAAVADYPAHAVLLDASVPGSGTTFRWSEASAWRGNERMLLAGGLDPTNVAAAVQQLQPMGVDVSSGVESAPGIKSAELIQRFVLNARLGPR